MHPTPTQRAWTRRTLSALAPALVGCLAGAANAVDCPQDRAIYSDAGGNYDLVFRPIGSIAASHVFVITANGTDVVLDGYVIDSDAPARPEGTLFYNCPEGDATGAEVRACRVWNGVIATIDAAGTAGFLGSDLAATQVVLPGFSRALAASSAWGPGKATVASGDVFKRKGCST